MKRIPLQGALLKTTIWGISKLSLPGPFPCRGDAAEQHRACCSLVHTSSPTGGPWTACAAHTVHTYSCRAVAPPPPAPQHIHHVLISQHVLRSSFLFPLSAPTACNDSLCISTPCPYLYCYTTASNMQSSQGSRTRVMVREIAQIFPRLARCT